MPLSGHKRVVLGTAIATLVVGATTAIAGTGVGAVFNLGQTNSVNAESRLRGSANAPMLNVENLNTGQTANGIVTRSRNAGATLYGGNMSTTDGGFGVRGNSTNGIGVLGHHTATSGAKPGVEGQTVSTSSNAAGVRGVNAATGPGSLSAGVFGSITDATTFSGAGVHARHAGHGYGVYSEALGANGSGLYSSGGFYGALLYASQPGSTAGYASGNGRGIDAYSEATTGTSYGVFGDADSASGGHGVLGRADGSTGTNYGVRGQGYSADGFGGFFENLAAGNNGTGVQGFGSGTTASGVPAGFFAGGGELTGGNGVIGATDRVSGYGVLGIQGPGAYAGYFQGDVNITGSTFGAGASMKIDHPLDPKDKYLSHSFVESPDMKSVYDGQVRLNGDGKATVKLPAYFEALNRDVRYQLTAIGAAAPRLHIAREVEDNSFAIGGGKPGMKVSWQVTGIRKDAYANANRIDVVEDKAASDRGSYLNPGAFGASPSQSVGAQTSGNVRNDPSPVPHGDTKARGGR